MLLRDHSTNKVMLDALEELLRDPQVTGNIDTIEISGACSPVGSDEYNRALALQRAEAIKTYLRWRFLPVVENIPFKLEAIGIDYEGYNALKADEQQLTEKQIWDLLQYASVRLRLKDGTTIPSSQGSPIREIIETEVAETEVVETEIAETEVAETEVAETEIIETEVAEAPAVPVPVPVPAPAPAPVPVPAPVNIIDTVKVLVPDTVRVLVHDTVRVLVHDTVRILLTDTVAAVIPQQPARKTHIALKTNLLYDLALLPNLAVEIPFGRWSALAGGNWSWWEIKAPHYWSHRIQWAEAGVRYWWNNNDSIPLTGWFAGLYAAAGTYDIRLFTRSLDEMGYLSNRSWSAGATGGYSLPLSRRWNMEFSISAGYFSGRYYKYNRSRCADCYPKRATGNLHYIGVTGAAVSLVYRFGEPANSKSKNNDASRYEQEQ
jgi:hypothetical protein